MSVSASRHERALAAACAVVAIFGTEGCFVLFGRHYDASHEETLVPVEPGAVAAQPQMADGALPIEVCRNVCVNNTYGARTEGCHLATLAVAPKAFTTDAPVIGATFVQCHEYTPGGSDFVIR